jgi:hypothetical protein
MRWTPYTTSETIKTAQCLVSRVTGQVKSGSDPQWRPTLNDILRMPPPPLRASLVELVHEHLAWRMPELVTRSAQTRRGPAEAQKIRVAHLAKPGAHIVELERLESDGTHGVNQSARQVQDEDYGTNSDDGQHDSQPAWDVFPSGAESRLRVWFWRDDFMDHNSPSVAP